MLVTVDEFLEQYPIFEKTEFDEEIIEGYLETAESLCNSNWKKKQQRGIKLLTAHWLTMEMQQTAVTASMGATIAAGNQVRTSGSEDDFSLTTYGRQYKHLRKTIPTTGFSF